MYIKYPACSTRTGDLFGHVTTESFVLLASGFAYQVSTGRLEHYCPLDV
jgi:hypothetical protein